MKSGAIWILLVLVAVTSIEAKEDRDPCVGETAQVAISTNSIDLHSRRKLTEMGLSNLLPETQIVPDTFSPLKNTSLMPGRDFPQLGVSVAYMGYRVTGADAAGPQRISLDKEGFILYSGEQELHREQGPPGGGFSLIDVDVVKVGPNMQTLALYDNEASDIVLSPTNGRKKPIFHRVSLDVFSKNPYVIVPKLVRWLEPGLAVVVAQPAVQPERGGLRFFTYVLSVDDFSATILQAKQHVLAVEKNLVEAGRKAPIFLDLTFVPQRGLVALVTNVGVTTFQLNRRGTFREPSFARFDRLLRKGIHSGRGTGALRESAYTEISLQGQNVTVRGIEAHYERNPVRKLVSAAPFEATFPIEAK